MFCFQYGFFAHSKLHFVNFEPTILMFRWICNTLNLTDPYNTVESIKKKTQKVFRF